MKKELDEQLVKDFPLLYGDRHGDMQSTCMVWGFPGDGWEPLIRRLSEKLEPLIQKFYDDNKNIIRCATCGCDRKKHYGSSTDSPGKCLAIHKFPTKTIYCHWSNWKYRWQHWYCICRQKVVNTVNRVLSLFFYELSTCWCEKYDPSIPRASQVKEKYGELCFYMTSATDEMFKLIDQAERESKTICEDCGQPGKLRKGSWLRTLCDKCNKWK